MGHNYTDTYEAYLWPLRHEPIKLLEIGLGVSGDAWHSLIVTGRNQTGGASLKMWHDYFPAASIYGIDVNPATHIDNDRIKTFVVDQGDVPQLGRFMGEIGDPTFDVVIDDGSHRPDHQQISFAFFFEHLRSGGLYFIEDLADNGLGDGRNDRYSSKSVLNTRTVFRQFAETGHFGEPNGLGSTTEFSDQIDWVHFHAPTPAINVGLGKLPRHPIKLSLDYRPRSEGICVIRKR